MIKAIGDICRRLPFSFYAKMRGKFVKISRKELKKLFFCSFLRGFRGGYVLFFYIERSGFSTVLFSAKTVEKCEKPYCEIYRY